MNRNTQHRSCIFISMLYCCPLSTTSERDKKDTSRAKDRDLHYEQSKIQRMQWRHVNPQLMVMQRAPKQAVMLNIVVAKPLSDSHGLLQNAPTGACHSPEHNTSM